MQTNIYKEAKRIIKEVPEIISTNRDIQKQVKSSEWYLDLPHTSEKRKNKIEEILGRELNEKELSWNAEFITMLWYSLSETIT